MAKWQELRTRLTEHTYFTPEQRDLITDQVLIVLEEDGVPEGPAFEKQEAEKSEAYAQGYEDFREETVKAVNFLKENLGL